MGAHSTGLPSIGSIRRCLIRQKMTLQWHRLGEYGLPGESSAFLLEMWRYVQEYFADALRGLEETIAPPTVRQARWWWRVHEALPNEDDPAEIYFWAELFTRREMAQDILGEPLYVADLEPYLAYKPWLSPNPPKDGV